MSTYSSDAQGSMHEATPRTEAEKSAATTLFSQVLRAGGVVSSELAHRFVAHMLYDGFGHIHPSIEQNKFKSLPVEFRLNLYESVARDPKPNIKFLDALNTELGLTEAFYAKQSLHVAEFLKKPFLGLTWAFKKWGTETFATAMHRALSGQATEAQKIELIQYTLKAYFKHRGLPKPDIKFVRGDNPNLQGECSSDGKEISINLNSTGFKANFLTVLNTVFHEPEHVVQINLAKDFKAGKIPTDHSDYLAARVFAANFGAFGYISSESNFRAYERQPTEVGARAAGELAEAVISERYGKPRLSLLTRIFGPSSPAPQLALA